jgi:GT2 family glycosyltransferase
MTAPPKVAICIVTHDSAPDLPACLEAVAALDHRPLEIVVVDCASGDGSAETARRAAPPDIPIEVVPLAENLGFAGGMNEALRRTGAPFVLLLNADARPAPDYATRLLEVFALRENVGGATGRLVRFPPSDAEAAGAGERILDACGMRLTLTWRHLDRGSGEPDRGQLSERERVFGATGAASMFRREALDDVAVGGEIFDSLFHSFREDAELCFRLRGRGWEIVYEPAAVALHRRWNVPRTRREMPPFVNFHSLKNRYLLRAYHQTWCDALVTFVPALARDLAALLYALLRERTSLAAYAWLWRNRPVIRARSREIRRRRTAGAVGLARWFLRDGEPL